MEPTPENLLKQFQPHWGLDFYDTMYFDDIGKYTSAISEFDEQANRIDVLKYSGYPPPATPKIWAALYGAMLKRLLESDDVNFVEQDQIIGVVFEWHIMNGQLALNPRGINREGDLVGGAPSPDYKNLYVTLKGNTLSKGRSFTFSKHTLLALMGFTSSIPDCKQSIITLYPVITDVKDQGITNTLFALATTVPQMPGNYGPAAYAPPCPPFCYP